MAMYKLLSTKRKNDEEPTITENCHPIHFRPLRSPLRLDIPTNHDEISNSTSKRFSDVVEQYKRVHKLSSVNPTVMTQAADHAGPQGDSYHQWDEYNPPTPMPKVLSPHQSDSIESTWSVGDNLSSPHGLIDVQNGAAASSSNVTCSALTPIFESPSTLISMDGGESHYLHCKNEEDEFGRGSYNSPKNVIDKTNLVSSSSHSTKGSSSKRERHPSFNFLPAKHCLQIRSTSRPSINVSMSSFWDDYERTAAGKLNKKHEHTPMRNLYSGGSQRGKTPSVFEIDSLMEPDSLEKKPIMPTTSICDHSVKKSKTDSITVPSCLPQLLMLDYTESPPYMPAHNNFNSNVTDYQEAWQRGANNYSSIRASQENIQHTESTDYIRNSFTGSSRDTLASPGNDATSSQPITTPMTRKVIDSLAETFKRDHMKRRNIIIGLSIMFIGAIMGMIGLVILVIDHNKKFAPYNGMYPNGLNSTFS